MSAVSVRGPQRTRRFRRLAWITIAVVAIGLLGAYVVLAVTSQPLIPGNAEGADRGTFVSSSSGFHRPARVLDYADGIPPRPSNGWATLERSA